MLTTQDKEEIKRLVGEMIAEFSASSSTERKYTGEVEDRNKKVGPRNAVAGDSRRRQKERRGNHQPCRRKPDQQPQIKSGRAVTATANPAGKTQRDRACRNRQRQQQADFGRFVRRQAKILPRHRRQLARSEEHTS